MFASLALGILRSNLVFQSLFASHRCTVNLNISTSKNVGPSDVLHCKDGDFIASGSNDSDYIAECCGDHIPK
jgi:hypothetical protein